MSRIVGRLIKFQRQRNSYNRILTIAPGLDFAEGDQGELARFLAERTTDPLLDLLKGSVKVTPSNELVQVLTAPFQTESVQEALERYPLNSPKMLGAAKAHGIDERILRGVRDYLDGEGR